ncbi:MAG: PH domain-containing protein [Sphaerochaetaceae bacterium]
MQKDNVIKRLQELYLYDLYGFRLELKPLAELLNIGEILNCVATGVYKGRRRMIAVTDYRVLVIASSVLAATEVFIIQRSAITSYSVKKRLIGSNLHLETAKETYVFTNTQKRILDLFLWALGLPVKQFDT